MDREREIANLADEFELDLIIMFGSRARGQQRGDSDTDVAVRGKGVFSFDDRLKLAVRLDRFFPNVDLIDIRDASPLLLAAVGQDGKLIYQRRESLFEEFKIFAWNQYMDFKPTLELLRHKNKEAMRELDMSDESED